jgi:chromosome segregation ATPase
MNGSGKSTVLLAISLCLGGKIPQVKAKEKGAGAASGSVLRTGIPYPKAAQIEIELLNEGDGGLVLPQDKFGKRVILRRTLTQGTESGRISSSFAVINGTTHKEIAKSASPNLKELEVGW